MSYYRVLGLQKEPFTTSPDPSFLYLSAEHRAALYRLRISVKLRRGLGLVLGDVGVGKTTLSRRFVQLVKDEPRVTVHMVLNPIFKDEKDFLEDLCLRFGIPAEKAQTAAYYFNEIENYLFKKGVNEGQTLVLLIDEAQKLNDECLEALRGLLNYETNEFKILQVVLFSQSEIVPRLVRIRNFWDRIALKHMLPPLDFSETREMIMFRLETAGYRSPIRLFSEEAFDVIYRATNGFPRQVTQLCHDSLEYLVMQNQSYVDKALVEYLVTRDSRLFSETGLKGNNPYYGTQQTSERFDARRAVV